MHYEHVLKGTKEMVNEPRVEDKKRVEGFILG